MLTSLLSPQPAASGDIVAPLILLENAAGSGWYDISADLMSGNTKRGKQRELDLFQAGSMALTLRNDRRQYDPNSPPLSLRLPGTTGNYASTPDSAAVSVGSNMLTLNQASIETDATGWTPGFNCTIAQTAAQALDGTKSLALTSSAAGGMGAVTAGARFAVLSWTLYSVYAYTRAATATRTFITEVLWYDLSGVFISAQTVGTSPTNSTTAWTQTGGSVTSPNNAGSAQVRVTINATAGAGEVHYLDRISLVQGTGDLDLRVRLSMDSWTAAGYPGLVAKYDSATNNISYIFYEDTGSPGAFALQMSPDGTGASAVTATSAAATTGFTGGTAHWARVTWRFSDGQVQFFTSEDGVTWTQLGSNKSIVMNAIFDSTAQVTVGHPSNVLVGNVYYAEVRAGINGTVIASFDSSLVIPTSFRAPSTYVAPTGETWTLNGSVWAWVGSPYGGSVLPMRRIHVMASAPDSADEYLRLTGASGNYASTPDSAATSITGDIDIRWKGSLDDWTPAASMMLVSKENPSTQRSYLFQVTAGGSLFTRISPDGTSTAFSASSSVIPGFTDGSTNWVRMTWRASDGRVQFFTSNDGITYTQLGTDQTANAGSIFNATSLLTIGARGDSGANDPLAGTTYYAEVRSGINGPVVASFDATRVYPTATRTPSTVLSATGETWTVNGSAWSWGVLTPSYLFSQGVFYADSWQQDYTGPHTATCTVTGTDAFKPLAAVKLKTSPYAQEVAADSPIHQWRLGESSGATQAIDTAGSDPLVTLNGTVSFGATGLPVGDANTAVAFTDLATNGLVSAGGAPYFSNGPFTVECLFRPSVFVADGLRRNLVLHTTTLSTGVVLYHTNGTVTAAVSTTNNLTGVSVSAGSPLVVGTLYHVSATYDATGLLSLYINGVLAASGSTSPVTITQGLAYTVLGQSTLASNSIATNAPGGTVDEVAFYSSALSVARLLAHYNGALGWPGDSPGTRAGRVLNAGGWSSIARVLSTGASVLQAPTDYGGQTVLDHLQRVAQSEFGKLYVDMNGSVVLESRGDGVNQTSLGTFVDAHNSGLGVRALTPEYTDQLIRNDVTIARAGGVSQNSQDAASVGQYLIHSYSLTNLYHNDDGLSLRAAQYLVSQYKSPLQRVRQLVLEPRKVPTTLFPQALGRELTDWVTVVITPQNVGAAFSQVAVIEGIQHDFGPKHWTTTWSLSPADTTIYWALGVAGFSELGVTTRLFF